MVAARLNSYLDDNNLHELLQLTYTQGHSTETTLVKVQNDILHSIAKRLHDERPNPEEASEIWNFGMLGHCEKNE